jgi:hypothetical protein
MPESPLQAAGAQIQPSAAAPLHTNEFFTGLWTQGSPFGPGAVPFLQSKYYSASRYDRLIGGINTEITVRLTLGRRPGNSVYNPGPFPPINRFYPFRTFGPAGEAIRLMASCDPAGGGTHGTVREVSAPAVNTILQTKDPAAGRTSFVGVGNELFWGDGVATKKWLVSQQAWKAATAFPVGTFIIDSNGNVQESVGAQTANITHVQIDLLHLAGGATGRKVTLFFDPLTPLDIPSNISLTLAGMTTIPALNGATSYTIAPQSSLQANFVLAGFGLPPVTAYSVETGTATTGTGITGGSQPVWNTNVGLVTQDGTLQWVCRGSAVTDWGTIAPLSAPTVSQAVAPTTYPSWAANTWYSPLFVIVDSNSNLQQLTTGGVTGGAPPVWNVALGGITNDNTAKWTNMGPGAWAASTVVALGKLVVASYTYYITVTQDQGYWNGTTYVPRPTQVQIAVTVTSLFQCGKAGTTDLNQPAWVNGLNTLTTEATGVVWQNLGTPQTWAFFGPAANVSTATTIVDANGYIEVAQNTGKSGATAPSPWPTDPNAQGKLTTDGSVTWLNGGGYAAAQPLPWVYAYSGKSSVTRHVGNASPRSMPITIAANSLAVIQGVGPTDPQDDQIVIWRTKGGGSILFQLDTFANPGPGVPWVYTDSTSDTALTGTSLIAPEFGGDITLGNSDNSPPDPAFIPCAYYLNRIWGFVGNVLKYSGGPDTGTGSGNESFPPDNEFTLPSTGITCWPTSIGLVVLTNSDMWVLLGQGTFDGNGNPVSPFYLVNFQQGVGILSQDAFSVNGSTAYAMLASGQVISMDPGAGEVEVGFPIGNIFDDFMNPATAYLAWHQGKSKDTALYVADGSSYWHRMAAVAAPESGNVWSPPAQITSPGKVKAIASVETAPGIKSLVLGPSVDGNPILVRDYTTNQDAGVSYQANAYIASVVLAQPGLVAGVQFVVTEEKMIAGASPLSVSMLYDEILSIEVPRTEFQVLRNITADPPNLPAQKSIRSQRLWAAQDANSVIKCRHFQQAILWPAENFPNEIYTNTVYGRLPEKARR